ncbi:hypothetical protein [Chitinimonas sp. BJYL2]|uniref:hypothetical protein n=1 Tax=Chitinimonas sp. BJYL2 TaxID=2976696 RepID=UPI0022B32278|nr:hypothetical protein [Chitinimonas sp. BJYL2]
MAYIYTDLQKQQDLVRPVDPIQASPRVQPSGDWADSLRNRVWTIVPPDRLSVARVNERYRSRVPADPDSPMAEQVTPGRIRHLATSGTRGRLIDTDA